MGIAATPAAAAADGHRAYELVTPPDSRAWIEVFGSIGVDNGDGIIFKSFDSLPGAVPNGPLPTSDSWIARRGASGWSSEWITDAPLAEPGTLGSQTVWTNEDGSETVMHTETGIDPGDNYPHSVDAYFRAADGTKSWLVPAPRPSGSFRRALAASPDLSRVLVASEASLLPDDDVDGSKQDLYLWKNGSLSLVTPGTEAGISVGLTASANGLAMPGTMSSDGSRIFFTTIDSLDPVSDTDVNKSDVYVREEGAYRLVSVEKRASLGALQLAPTTVIASNDGSVACYGSRVQFEDADTDSQEDVYCYNLDTDTLDRASTGLNDNDSSAAKLVTLSRDGAVVYFTTASVLTEEDSDGGPSLYRRTEGATEYVIPLDPSDLSTERRIASSAYQQRALRINTDGSRILFTTARQLLPSDTDSQPDIYRWAEGQGLTQISIGPNGGNGDFEANFGRFEPEGLDDFTGRPVGGRVYTDDEEAIFFESKESLVAADIDGGRLDVYEWREGGDVRLISSSGSFPADAYYLDNSPDGSTVFFATPESLSPFDINGGVRDIYAARIGGGFPSKLPPAGCVGDGCQGPPTPPPLLRQPSTGLLAGRGNVVEPRRSGTRNGAKKCAKGKRKVRQNGHAICVAKKNGKKMRGKGAQARKSTVTAKGGSY